ncbi:uncharacterized protein LOC126894072 isoform X2 [Daktulosphaira vitifoliae]|uniref:uncharacterized protein LOC126894072 isoform X2 n=1 Tax=Daktulosphaira vitifoliae TaxID=58002 RepID=UPI0021AAB1DD|nr:uncharacterized protein LOC126894072 isoform X2 [Daktulosphaira vitifoliae]
MMNIHFKILLFACCIIATLCVPSSFNSGPSKTEDSPKEQVEIPKNDNVSVFQNLRTRVKSKLLLAGKNNDNQIFFKDLVEVYRNEVGKDISANMPEENYRIKQNTKYSIDELMKNFDENHINYVNRIATQLQLFKNINGYIPVEKIFEIFGHFSLNKEIQNEIRKKLSIKDNNNVNYDAI